MVVGFCAVGWGGEWGWFGGGLGGCSGRWIEVISDRLLVFCVAPALRIGSDS